MIEGAHFQNAYITRNVDKWLEDFKTKADIRKLITYEGSTDLWTPGGMTTQTTKLALVWIEDLQIELIQPISGGAIYSDVLPADDSLKFHHACHRVKNWDDFRARVDTQEYPVALERGGEEHLKFLYLDTRALLGHYLEYVWMKDEIWLQMGGR